MPMLGHEQVQNSYQNGCGGNSGRRKSLPSDPPNPIPGLGEIAQVGVEARRAARQMSTYVFVASFSWVPRQQPECLIGRAAATFGVWKRMRQIGAGGSEQLLFSPKRFSF